MLYEVITDAKLITGARAISGAFTEQAWKEYVRDAIKNAATDELQSSDWVLKTSVQDDLTHQGSPEQIRITSYNVCYTKLLRTMSGRVSSMPVTARWTQSEGVPLTW